MLLLRNMRLRECTTCNMHHSPHLDNMRAADGIEQGGGEAVGIGEGAHPLGGGVQL